jgi:hypothetical protein
MVNKKIAGLVLGALFASTSMAADDIAEDYAGWMQFVGEGSLKGLSPSLAKNRIWLEGQARFDDHNWVTWYQGMVRAAVGYSLSDRATIWAGYTWLPTHNIGKTFVSQQDVWPAFRYILPTSFGTITFRTMIESNFIQGADVRFRPRQMVRFLHPFDFEPRLSFIAWDELFIRINSTQYGGKSGFDQNRAFVGLGWTFNSTFRSELGYMNQYLDDLSHTNNTMRHTLMGSLFISF